MPCKPPKWLFRLLVLLLEPFDRESFPGDLEELYHDIRIRHGRLAAHLWFAGQVVIMAPIFCLQHLKWSAIMFKNYFKVALRTFLRQKAYTFINIIGLALGLACCLYLFLLVRHELSYDDFHEKKDGIYRIVTQVYHDGTPFVMAPTMLPLADALKNELPEARGVTRISKHYDLLCRYGENRFFEDFYFVDNDFLDIFTFPLLQGEDQHALDEPNTLVLTRRSAEKYFGEENPVGKVLMVWGDQPYKITGVIDDVPGNSHLRFGFLASFSSLNNTPRVRSNNWQRFSNDYTYVLFDKKTDPDQMEQKITAIVQNHTPEDDNPYVMYLQNLKEIRFSTVNYDSAHTASRSYLYAVSAVGALILLIACLNYINLATARSVRRAKEVGMRKVIGARKGHLIGQFLSESVLLALFSWLLAWIMMHLMLPGLNRMMRQSISLSFGESAPLFIGLSLVVLVIGLLAGSYPAFLLASYKPARIFRRRSSARKSRGIRTFFVVFQFSISVALIIMTLVIRDQIAFMISRDPGIPQDRLMVVRMPDRNVREKWDVLKSSFKTSPLVLSITASSSVPACGTSTSRSMYKVGEVEGDGVYVQTISADEDFFRTLGLDMLNGRDFSAIIASDKSRGMIINQTAVSRLGLSDPVNAQLTFGDDEVWSVVGVAPDFNFYSMHSGIDPLSVNIDPSKYRFITVRFDPRQADAVRAHLEAKWKEIVPQYPFSSYIMADEMAGHYGFERRLSSIFGASALLAIVVACLGVLGLVSYMTEQRTKEIGIRKVLGSSVPAIVGLLLKDLIRWILLANLIAWPSAWWARSGWISSFAFQSSVKWWIFIAAGASALMIGLMAVSFLAIRAALTDPARSLRYE